MGVNNGRILSGGIVILYQSVICISELNTDFYFSQNFLWLMVANAAI